jgi:exodeoxyribonuclease V gamma subunit
MMSRDAPVRSDAYGGRQMLHVHRSERADALVRALTALLADPLPDPFAREVVSVPTRGMERWLSQRMSAGLGAAPGRADGVCANVDFPTPARLVGDAVATASGIDPDADPWKPERAVWPLLEIVDASLAEPWLERLAHHLGDTSDEARRGRRFASVRHLADLFDRYALYRPAMLADWAAGADGGWQAELWRRLRARLPVPGPAERVEAACAALRADPGLVDLPPRLALFGLTRLPAGRLRILEAIAAHRDVHLFLLHPSPAQWERLKDHPPVVRREDVAKRATNPLLASWGHDSRELQLVLGSGHEDHLHPVEHREDTLLARVQHDVRADRRETHAADASIQVHSCHGRARQVEVLRDAILHLLAEDPTLEPRDVIVMCPDIETFAPLIQATFGAGAVDDEAEPADGAPPDLRVRLADRSLRQTNPILGVIARLIELAGERLTASQVLDLADREPVRRRMQLDDDDLARLEEWVRASGIRWGLDAAHRAPFKLDALPSGTWRAGLDRLLLGVTMSEDEQRLFERVLPLDDVESGAIDLAGRFAELVDRLQAAVDSLSRPQPIGDWATALAAAADALTEAAPRDAWQRAELQRILDDVVGEAAGNTAELALPELRTLLADRLKGRPTRANFRTGHLTICTLVPMRSVPHRVVCLLGLDDGVFPRKTPRDGDDLLLDDPHIGERDARTEDRQLLLDALMAATDKLIVTYTGNDERTNLARPPAVPVGELLDLVGSDVVVRHPLQPFDQRNFEPGALIPERVWSFDRVTLRGARALTHERRPRAPFLPEPLPPLDSPLIELDDLVRFVERPVRAFLRRRLGITVADYSDDVKDALPVELDGLEQWEIGTRLLEARLAGMDRRAAILAEIGRGTLPPYELGMPVIHKIDPVVDEIVERAPPGESTSLDVRVALPDGRVLTGTVAGVVDDVLRTVTYSRVSPRHRIAAWVRLLALQAGHPTRDFEAVTVGRGPDGVTVARTGGLDAALALDHLAAVVDLYDRGMREPAPLYCLTSAAYAAGADARAAWESARFPGEDAEPDHELVLGGRRTFAELTAAPARPDERWDMDETRRFGRWARRLWDPLLDHER